MAQEDEILSLRDALLASVAKSENSRGSCGDDDEINDEELTALRFAALISKKPKHHLKPQPIGTTVPAVPAAAATPQNPPVLPTSTSSQHSQVPGSATVFPVQSYRQHFPHKIHGAGSQFSSHHSQKRSSNLIVIQTQQPQQSDKDSSCTKGSLRSMNDSAPTKSVFLRPQDKWDRSREETKVTASPEPKVSAKFRRLMSRDSDSDDDDDDESEDEITDGKSDAESLFICHDPKDEGDNEMKSIGSPAQSDGSAVSASDSNQSSSKTYEEQQHDLESSADENEDPAQSSSPGKSDLVAKTASGTESSREPSPALSSVSRKSSSSQNSFSSACNSLSPARSKSCSVTSQMSHISSVSSKSQKNCSLSPVSVQSHETRQSARQHSSSLSSCSSARGESPHEHSNSPSPCYSDRSQHESRPLRYSRSPSLRHRSLKYKRSRSPSGRPSRYSMSRSPASPSADRSLRRRSKSPAMSDSYERSRMRRRRSDSVSPGHSQRRGRLLRRSSRSPDSHLSCEQIRSPRRGSFSPVSHDAGDWSRSLRRASPSCHVHEQSRSQHEQSRSQRRCSGSQSPHRLYRYGLSERRHTRSPHHLHRARSPVKPLPKDPPKRRSRSPLLRSRSPHRMHVRRRSSSPHLTQSPQKSYLRSVVDGHSPSSRYCSSDTPLIEHKTSRAVQDSRIRDYSEKSSARRHKSTQRRNSPKCDKQIPPADRHPDGLDIQHITHKSHQRDQKQAHSQDRGMSHRETEDRHSAGGKKNSHRSRREEFFERKAPSEKTVDKQATGSHPSSQNKENKYHRSTEHLAGHHDVKKASNRHSPSKRKIPKQSSLSAEERARLEARQKKFASMSEVKISEPKKISLKDIVKSIDGEKNSSVQHARINDSPVAAGEDLQSYGIDADLDSESIQSKKKSSRKLNGPEDKKSLSRQEKEYKSCHERKEDHLEQKIKELEDKRDRIRSQKIHQSNEILRSKSECVARSSGVRPLLSVVTTAKGAREISYRQSKEVIIEKAGTEKESKQKELEDARQIILRVEQKAKELKSLDVKRAVKDKQVSDAASPTISVTFNKDQSRLPVYERLGQPVARHDKSKTSAKSTTMQVKSERGEAGEQATCSQSGMVHVDSKTVDLRDILESRKNVSKGRSGFKRKSKRVDKDDTFGEKKKIRLKRPGRQNLHSTVLESTEQY